MNGFLYEGEDFLALFFFFLFPKEITFLGELQNHKDQNGPESGESLANQSSDPKRHLFISARA